VNRLWSAPGKTAMPCPAPQADAAAILVSAAAPSARPPRPALRRARRSRHRPRAARWRCGRVPVQPCHARPADRDHPVHSGRAGVRGQQGHPAALAPADQPHPAGIHLTAAAQHLDDGERLGGPVRERLGPPVTRRLSAAGFVVCQDDRATVADPLRPVVPLLDAAASAAVHEHQARQRAGRGGYTDDATQFTLSRGHHCSANNGCHPHSER
jgi:hypothetical protein